MPGFNPFQHHFTPFNSPPPFQQQNPQNATAGGFPQFSFPSMSAESIAAETEKMVKQLSTMYMQIVKSVCEEIKKWYATMPEESKQALSKMMETFLPGFSKMLSSDMKQQQNHYHKIFNQFDQTFASSPPHAAKTNKLTEYFSFDVEGNNRFWQSEKESWAAMARGECVIQARQAASVEDLSAKGYRTVMRAVLPHAAADTPLSLNDLKKNNVPGNGTQASLVDIGGYLSTDIMRFSADDGSQVLYIPGEKPSFMEFTSKTELNKGLRAMLQDDMRRDNLLQHFPAKDMASGKIMKGIGDFVQKICHESGGERYFNTHKKTLGKDIFSAVADKVAQQSSEEIRELAKGIPQSSGRINLHQRVPAETILRAIGGLNHGLAMHLMPDQNEADMTDEMKIQSAGYISLLTSRFELPVKPVSQNAIPTSRYAQFAGYAPNVTKEAESERFFDAVSDHPDTQHETPDVELAEPLHLA